MQHQRIIRRPLPWVLREVFDFRAVFAVGQAHHAGDGHADRQFERPAAHLFRHRIHKGDAQVAVGGDHPFADGVEGDVQALFLFVQRLGEALELGHVDIGADQAQRPALIVEDHVALAADMAHFAAARSDAKLHDEWPRLRQDLGQLAIGALAIFRHQQGAPQRQRRRLVGGEIVEFEHALIPGEVFLAHHPFPDADAAHLVGQRDALHQPVVLRLAALKVADVLHLRDEVQRPAFAVAHQRDRQQRPDRLAVAADIAFFHGVAADMTVEQFVQLGQVGVQIVRVGDLLKGQAIKSFRRIAEQLAQRLVNLQPFALRRHQRHADGGILQRAAKAAFALDDMLLFHPEGVHHHRHGVRRDQDQQHRQIEAEFAQESVLGRLKVQQAQRQQDGDQQESAETDGEGFEARQGDSRPQQRQDDEGKGEGQMRQRQIAEGQRAHQGQQQRIRI